MSKPVYTECVCCGKAKEPNARKTCGEPCYHALRNKIAAESGYTERYKTRMRLELRDANKLERDKALAAQRRDALVGTLIK